MHDHSYDRIGHPQGLGSFKHRVPRYGHEHRTSQCKCSKCFAGSMDLACTSNRTRRLKDSKTLAIYALNQSQIDRKTPRSNYSSQGKGYHKARPLNSTTITNPPHFFTPSLSPSNIHLSSSILATFLFRLLFSAALISSTTAAASQCAFCLPYMSMICFSDSFAR